MKLTTLKWLFKVPPKVGSFWVLGNPKNPFNESLVRVMEVRNGYVRYAWAQRNGATYGGSSASIRDFRFIYGELNSVSNFTSGLREIWQTISNMFRLKALQKSITLTRNKAG